MILPHLLRYDASKEIAPFNLSNLGLTELFSINVQNVLCHPCGQENIQLRQELFSNLENESFKMRLSTCLMSIKKIDKLLIQKNKAANILEKNYTRLKILNQYMIACHELAALSDGGALLLDVSKYLSTSGAIRNLDNMKSDCQTVHNLLVRIQSSYLSFMDKNWVIPAEDREGESIFDKICTCATNLGLSVPENTKHTFVIDSSLVDSISLLYSNEMAAIDELLSKYEQPYLYELAILIPEISFFLEITDLCFKAHNNGIHTCIPTISNEMEYTATQLIDISLLSKTNSIVPNDAMFVSETPFFFLTGANGGGKTTYLRAVAINLILFISGCPIFAKQAKIYPFSSIWTHFPSDEQFINTGRLGDEIKRVNEMFRYLDNSTFVLFNETFSSTDVDRGYELLIDTATKLTEGRYFGLYVTHFLEVANLTYPLLTVEVDEKSSNLRTFRVVCQRGNISSYATDILKKYHLDKESLEQRRIDNDA